MAASAALWAPQWAAIVMAIVVVLVPGLLLGAVARVRGIALWALAPVLSAAVLTVGSLVAGVLGFGWSPVVALISAAVASGAAFLLGRLLRWQPTAGWREVAPHRHALLGVGIVAGAVFVTCRLAFYIADPAAISQTNDAAFHLSALRFILDTGAASPLELSRVIGGHSFYPSAWHVLASLVAQLSGCGIEVAANVTSIAIAAIAWPLGIGYLTRVVAGPVAAAAAATASAAIPAYPLVLMQWGILYPQLLAVAIVPATIAVIVDRGLWGQRGDHRWVPAVRGSLLLVAAVAAIALAQPSVLLPVGVAAVSWLAFGPASGWRLLTTRARGVRVVATITAAIVVGGLWIAFGRSVSVSWPPSASKPIAVLEVVANGYLGYPWAIGVSLAVVLGLVACVLRRDTRWLVLCAAVFGGLYAVSAALGNGTLRKLLVGPWYEDPYRLAALAPVFVLPLAGAGVAAAIAWFAARTAVNARGAERVGIAIIAAVGVISLVVAPQIQRRDVFAHVVDPNLYAVTADSFLSADELALLERLDAVLPHDAVVIGNPSTGMSFGYAVSGRNVIPRTWAPPSGDSYAVLWESMRDVASDPRVCAALDDFGARYVLDFGPGEVYPGRWIMPGFDDLVGRDGFEVIASVGEAALLRVTVCD